MKVGRPKSTHRGNDTMIFIALPKDTDWLAYDRTEWQKLRLKDFQEGKALSF